MTVSLEVLQSLASTFSTELAGSPDVQPGRPVTLRLVPSTAEGLRATDVVGGDLRLTWITKSVRFNDAATESALSGTPFSASSVDALIAGGMPVRLPMAGNLVGTQELTGVPGTLAQLAGTFPIAVEVPVRLAVSWDVLDEHGNPITTGFNAPAGMGAPELVLDFAVQTVELTTDTGVPVAQRSVRATVTLTVTGTAPYTFTLPPVALRVTAIPIPAVVAMFLHADFAGLEGDDDGAAFVLVPNNSPIRSLEQLQETLHTLRSTVSGLTSIAEFALFLTGIDALSGALTAQPNVEFRVASAQNDFDNFNDVTLLEKPFGWLFGWTNIEAEDELSSLIIIGPQGKHVQFFNARDEGTGEGAFEVTVGPKLFMTIRDLKAATTSAPDGNEVTVPFAGSFNDRLSSLRFQ